VGRRIYRLTIDRDASSFDRARLLAGRTWPDRSGYQSAISRLCDVPLVSNFASYSDDQAERRIPGDGELLLLSFSSSCRGTASRARGAAADGGQCGGVSPFESPETAVVAPVPCSISSIRFLPMSDHRDAVPVRPRPVPRKSAG